MMPSHTLVKLTYVMFAYTG